jgi:predicted transcriptional regulator
MSKPSSISRFVPTESEFRILKALWLLGPSTVAAVQAYCSEDRAMGYTTALKFLQILWIKKAVVRRRQGRLDIYQTTVTQEEVNRALILKHLHLMYNGSALLWVRSALKFKLIRTQDLHKLILKKKKTKSSRRKK